MHLRKDEARWRACERWACERYDLDYRNKSYYDAVDDSGNEVEIKSCRLRHDDGNHGKMKIWKDQYVLADYFIFVVYTDNGVVWQYKAVNTGVIDKVDWSVSDPSDTNRSVDFPLYYADWSTVFRQTPYDIRRYHVGKRWREAY
jgi:hypothetical protein